MTVLRRLPPKPTTWIDVDAPALLAWFQSVETIPDGLILERNEKGQPFSTIHDGKKFLAVLKNDVALGPGGQHVFLNCVLKMIRKLKAALETSC